MRELVQDLRYGARWLARQRGFTFVVTLTLALAIGVNTVIFSIASFLLLRPLPFADVDRLAALYTVDTQRGADRGRASDPDLADWRAELGTLETIGAYGGATVTLTGRGDAMRLQAREVTSNLLDVWGIPVATGRGFQVDDGVAGAAPVVILSDGFWQRQFDADPGILGERLTLDGRGHTVIGVLTPAIELGTLSLIDVWVPTAIDGNAARDARRLQVFGRLRPGATVEQATAEIAALAARLADAHPVTHAGWSARAVPLREAMTGTNTGTILTMLGLVVSFVLVIACANIANLMLARAVARRKELAVRAAIGAGRLRLVRQLLTEAALLGLAGGLVGLVLAEGGLRLIKAVTFEPFFQQIAIDGRVLLFVAVLTIVTPLLFSLLPALQAARMNLSQAIGEGAGRTSGGVRGRRGRNALVVAQLSLAAMLLVLSTLIVRSAIEQAGMDIGFDPSNVLTLQVDLDGPRYADADGVRRFTDDLLGRLSSLPGATAAAATSALPIFGTPGRASFAIEGQPVDDPAARPWAQQTTVSLEYFRVFDIPLVAGRGFEARDRDDVPDVAIISREAARRYWPDADPIGRRILLGTSGAPVEIVGIAGDVFNGDQFVDGVEPALYLPLVQHPQRALAFVLRTATDPASLVEPVRREFRVADPEQAVFDVRPMAQVFWEQLASDRLLIGMFTSFAVLALVLASAGLYGLMSYSVAQRTQEFGVRLALGARGRDVVRGVVRSGLGLAATGLAIGLLGGYALARAIANLLYGVGPTDPVTYGSVTAALVVVSVLGSFLPARRAITQDPIRALRR